MKTSLATLALCLLPAAGLAAQEKTQEKTQEKPAQVIDRAASKANQDLASSTQELSQLRDEISNEKLPLAQELTALEEKLTELRKEHARVTALADKTNLEAPRIKTSIKLKEEELTYIGGLLDDYVRTFETRINASELQNSGAAIEHAKQAKEDTSLSLGEQFDRQVEFVDMSVKRLFDAIGGMRFPGKGVDLQGTVLDGQFAILGPVALFGAATGGLAGLVVPQSGSLNPLIRPLEGALQVGLAALVTSGDGELPLDPSRGGALKALVQKGNLFHIFLKGGPIMWPLLLASILSLGTVLERVLFLLLERTRRDNVALDRFFAAVREGKLTDAIAIGLKSRFYVVRALGYALSHKEQSLESAVLYAQAQELKRYRRGIPILDTVITLAPLLGLLGTVTGMMGSFSIIGGDLDSPGAITGGIAEALIATAFGLGIAITSLLPFNFLNTKMEDARHEIESAATQLELLVQHPAGHVASASASPSPNGSASPERDRTSREPELQRV